VTVDLATHPWLGGLILVGVAGALFSASLITRRLRLQRQAAVALAARPLAFWPVVAFLAAGRLALFWAACGGKAPFGSFPLT